MPVLAEDEIFRRQLRSFVPPDSFDVHAHLHRHADALALFPRELENENGNVGWKEYCRFVGSWMGDRTPTAGLFFAIPKPTIDMASANEFLADEIDPVATSRTLLLIRPDDDPDRAAAAIAARGFSGFKVYHVYAKRPDTPNADIVEYLPEWAWEIADRHGLAIMLHMVKARAIADPVNQQYVREHCLKYRNANLILAHAARGFCGRHTVEGIGAIAGLDNVFFDTSAICEATPMEAILRTYGPSRLMFGTDFCVSEIKGKCVSVGDGFLWLYENNVDWSKSAFAQPVRIGLESLLAVQEACTNLSLKDREVEQIFGTNARQMLRIGPPPTGAQGASVYSKARKLIPGGVQLLSKRPEMYAPGQWPAYFAQARGCEVVDWDGRRFCDMTTSGIGSCLLGYADPDVRAAVQRRVELGSMSTLNCVEEVDLAELLLALHPWAEQVRYCRTGGESMAVAVRIARAATRRDSIAFCGYHGWSDWYLAANLNATSPQESQDSLKGHLLPGLSPDGVPRGLGGTMLPFAYNHLDQLKEQVRAHGSKLAAVVMEPTRSVDPEPGFLEGVRALCDECGAALVLDEITSGWRMLLGGAHLRYHIRPDIAVFAKGLANGHPMGAVIGRQRFMDVAQTSFISSTYWTEGVGPAAALATIEKFQRIDVPEHVARIGERFRQGWLALANSYRVPARATGHAALLSLTFDHPQAAALGTLFTVRMLARGFLTGGGFYPSLGHCERHVDDFMASADDVFAEIAQAIAKSDIEARIGGPVRQTGFARLT